MCASLLQKKKHPVIMVEVSMGVSCFITLFAGKYSYFLRCSTRMTGQLHVSLFGSFRLVRNGVEVSAKDWQTRQARQLFKLLLAERGRPVSSGKLIDLLWPDHVE